MLYGTPLLFWALALLAFSAMKKVLRQNGLFTFIMANNMGSMVFVVPPLCITQVQIDEGLAIVEKALEVTDKQVK